MLTRLRSLPAPWRYVLYLAGMLVVAMLSIGMGIAAATVLDWQSRMATNNPQMEARTTRDGGSEATVATRSTENTTSEPPIATSDPAKVRAATSFVHRATAENSRGDYTVVSDPALNGHPNAIMLVSPISERDGAEKNAPYDHNIGVWYTPVTHKWAIFNQDLAAVPAGSTFEIVVPADSASFVHRADTRNSAGDHTYLDNRLTNGERDAVLEVTQNWNPGGGRGVYNDHPIGTRYDADLGEWALYNRDGAAMPDGAAFNVAVSAGVDESSK